MDRSSGTRKLLALIALLTGCGGSKTSAFTSLTPVPLNRAGDTLGALSIEVRGVDPRRIGYGQVWIRTGTRYRSAKMDQVVRFDSLAPGSYEVRAQMIGYAQAVAQVSVSGRTVVRLRAEMRPSKIMLQAVLEASDQLGESRTPFVSGSDASVGTGTIQGLVVSREESPVPLGEAAAYVSGTAVHAYSSADGAFTLEGLQPGVDTLVVRKIGYATVSVPLAIPARGGLWVVVRLEQAMGTVVH